MLWIVVIVYTHYPSVLHFENEVEARKAYEKYKGEGFAVHLAKVHEHSVDEEHMKEYGKKFKEISDLDVKWVYG